MYCHYKLSTYIFSYYFTHACNETTKATSLVFLVILIVWGTASSIAAQSTFEIELCDFCKALDTYIPDVGGTKTTTSASGACDVSKCIQSTKFELALNASKTMRHSIEVNEDAKKLIIETSTSMREAQLLVFEFLGRQVVSDFGSLLNEALSSEGLVDMPAIFTYNALSGLLEIQYPSCRYEKSIYSTLLVVSVVIILLGIVLQFLQKWKIPVVGEKEDEKSKTQPKNVCGFMNEIGSVSTIKDGAFRFGVMQESGAGLRSRVS